MALRVGWRGGSGGLINFNPTNEMRKNSKRGLDAPILVLRKVVEKLKTRLYACFSAASASI